MATGSPSVLSRTGVWSCVHTGNGGSAKGTWAGCSGTRPRPPPSMNEDPGPVRAAQRNPDTVVVLPLQRRATEWGHTLLSLGTARDFLEGSSSGSNETAGALEIQTSHIRHPEGTLERKGGGHAPRKPT